ncbi:MAG: hypothetical protein Q9216_004253 [Gyalolechia sp. 2 TL-2023]
MATGAGTPDTDLLSYIFGKEPADLEKPILIDASSPSRFLTFSSARTAVRKLIAGLREEGVKKDDCVCINAFNDVAQECEIPESRVFTFDTKDQAAVPGRKSWTGLLQHGEADWLTFDKPGQAKSTISTLAFTSGTTGFPKAAMVPHLYAISQLNALDNQKPPYEVTRPWSVVIGIMTE